MAVPHVQGWAFLSRQCCLVEVSLQCPLMVRMQAASARAHQGHTALNAETVRESFALHVMYAIEQNNF